MNRKQRRATESMLRKKSPELMRAVDRINQEHRARVEAARNKAEQALWTILGRFGIKEAQGRWFLNSSFIGDPYVERNHIVYGNADFTYFDKLHSSKPGKSRR